MGRIENDPNVSPATTRPSSNDSAARPPLGFLLRQAAAAHRLAMERLLADVDVTPPQFLMLRLLAEHPGSSNAELSRMAALTTPTVTVIVANLIRRQALASRPHEAHGRVRHLDLTDSGQALLAACKARAYRAEQELEAGLTPAEAAFVARWLSRAAMPTPRLADTPARQS